MVRLVTRSLATFVVLTVYSYSVSANPQSQSRFSTDSRGGYTLVLVDVQSQSELAEARDFITSQGGSVAIVVPPHAIMGWIRPESDSAILGRHGIHSIYRSSVASTPARFRDRETQLAINAFNDIASGRSARRRLRESQQQTGPASERPGMIDCSLPHPSLDKDNFIRNLRLLGAEKSVQGIQSTVTPQYFSNTDVMDGRVSVALFLVESAGGIDPNVYSWTQADQDLAFAQVLDGLNWWVEQSRAFNLARPLQFSIVPFLATNPVCQVPYEPVLRPGSDAQLWVSQIRTNLKSLVREPVVI